MSGWQAPRENREDLEKTQNDILEGLNQPEGQDEDTQPEELEGQEIQKQEQGQGQGEYISRDEYEALRQERELLQKRLNVLGQNMMSPEYIEFLESKRGGGYGSTQQGRQQTSQTSNQERESEIDFETASQKEIADYVMNRVNQLVEERVGEVNKKVSNQEYKAQYQGIQQEVGELEKQYPDFWNYQQDMVDIAQRYPNMRPKEVYLLAKGQTELGSSRKATPPQKAKPQGQEPQQPKPRPIAGGAKPRGISTQSAKEDRKHTYESAIEQVMKDLNL